MGCAQLKECSNSPQCSNSPSGTTTMAYSVTLRFLTVPLPASTSSSSTNVVDHLCFYIVPVKRGLCRVQVSGVWTKYGQPSPLLNGTVISQRALPVLLRQTICSAARRKTVEMDNYQMCHVRRRHAIAEFGRRFATRLNYTNFVEELTSDG